MAWLISSLQPHLPSIHPPHCWQNDLAADPITSLWRLKSSSDSPFVRPSLIWPLLSAQVSIPILSLYIVFQQCWIPRTSSKKSLSLLYLPDSSPGAPLSVNQSTDQATWLTRRAIPTIRRTPIPCRNRRSFYARGSLFCAECSQQYHATLINIKCRTQPFLWILLRRLFI